MEVDANASYDKNGESPLFLAALLGSAEIVQLLMNYDLYNYD